MTENTQAFDGWIRSSFIQMNTDLEETYFAQSDRSAVESVGMETKEALVDEGRSYIETL